jgi:hypothetical protein
LPIFCSSFIFSYPRHSCTKTEYYMEVLKSTLPFSETDIQDSNHILFVDLYIKCLISLFSHLKFELKFWKSQNVRNSICSC